MRVRERHRHVEIGDARGEARTKEWHDKTRVECVHDSVDTLTLDEFDNGLLVAAVQLKGGKPITAANDCPLGA